MKSQRIPFPPPSAPHAAAAGCTLSISRARASAVWPTTISSLPQSARDVGYPFVRRPVAAVRHSPLRLARTLRIGPQSLATAVVSISPPSAGHFPSPPSPRQVMAAAPVAWLRPDCLALGRHGHLCRRGSLHWSSRRGSDEATRSACPAGPVWAASFLSLPSLCPLHFFRSTRTFSFPHPALPHAF